MNGPRILFAADGFTSVHNQVPLPYRGLPVVADFSGDGTADFAELALPDTFEQSWRWVIRTVGSSTAQVSFGLLSDVPAQGDYDGDGKADIAVYRPSEGRWYVRTATGAVVTYSWGLRGDQPIVSAVNNAATAAMLARTDLRRAVDFDGDSHPDITVFRPNTGQWFVLESRSNFQTASVAQWGLPGDRIVPGDYDGDGKADPAVFRPANSTWYTLLSGSNYSSSLTAQWGLDGDTPVAGDYDGDGTTDLAVFRAPDGWYLRLSGGGTQVVSWGLSGDIPVPADYDGDGRTDPAVFRPSTGYWYIRSQIGVFTIRFGQDGDVRCRPTSSPSTCRACCPSAGQQRGVCTVILRANSGASAATFLPADYDGDRLIDFTFYRPSSRHWFVLLATGTAVSSAMYRGEAYDSSDRAAVMITG